MTVGSLTAAAVAMSRTDQVMNLPGVSTSNAATRANALLSDGKSARMSSMSSALEGSSSLVLSNIIVFMWRFGRFDALKQRSSMRRREALVPPGRKVQGHVRARTVEHQDALERELDPKLLLQSYSR